VTGLKYDATGDFYRAGLANYVLGGMFSSRLNLNLREDKAWTYGARSGFYGNRHTGTFAFSSGIKSDATADALGEVMKELGHYAAEGIQADELAFMRSAIRQRDALEYETPSQKAAFIGQILEYNLDGDYVEKQNKILDSIQEAEIDKTAARWIRTNALNIVLVGDKAKVLPGLQKCGLEIVELDVDGGPVKPSSTN
jgi:zinc protease